MTTAGAVAELLRYEVPSSCAGQRLDVALARLAGGLSRARIQKLVEAGGVRIGGRAVKAGARLRGGETVEVELPPPEPTGLLAEDLPLSIRFEDRDLLVLDKAAGMVVHPARGSPRATVVNALLHHLGRPAPPAAVAREPEGAPSRGGERLGLVHRLDKETSGLLVVAKSETALAALQAQWKARTVEKLYLALCHGALAAEGRLDTPYGRHPKDRTRYSSKLRSAPRRAVTTWRVRERFGDLATLAEVALHTGRTHQIRVHLADLGHPLLADAVYGGGRREARLAADHPLRRAAAAVGRQALHAFRLGFDHPRTGKRLLFEAPVPGDLAAALELLRDATQR